MKKLETLLNTLIQMGWKPWGKDAIKMSKQCPDRETGVIYIHFTGEERGYRHIRQLVSVESGLWQFVCEKELVPYQTSGQIIKRYVNETVGRYSGNILEGEVISSDLDYEYRLLESALLPEEKLEKFLLDNIVLEGNSK